MEQESTPELSGTHNSVQEDLSSPHLIHFTDSRWTWAGLSSTAWLIYLTTLPLHLRTSDCIYQYNHVLKQRSISTLGQQSELRGI